MKRSEGFTLVDLVVMLVSVAILVTLLSCLRLWPGNEPANQAACKANMRGIGTAIAMYKSECDNKFPLLFNTGDPNNPIDFNSSAESMRQLAENPNNHAAMQNVWRLVEQGHLTEEAFHCPSDVDYKARSGAPGAPGKYGWTSSRQFSYGIHYPYRDVAPLQPETAGRATNPAYLDAQLKGSFVIMADKNPGPGGAGDRGVGDLVDGVVLKPSNHPRDGEAYLMFSGAADWKRGNANSKVNGDCIYSIDPRGNIDPSTPRDLDDQYIIPHPRITGN